MRRARWTVSLVIIGLMLFSIGLVSAQGPNTITGTVTDAITGAPIDGALVNVDDTEPDSSATTDATGVYEITNVPIGEHSVTASAEGYEAETETGVEVSDAEGASLDFALEPVDVDEDEGAGDGDHEEGDDHEEERGG